MSFTPISDKLPKKRSSKIIKFLLIFTIIVLGAAIVFIAQKIREQKKVYKAKAGERCDDPFYKVGNCIRSKDGSLFNVTRYHCENRISCDGGIGCGENEERLNRQSEVCLQESCGVEQIDTYLLIGGVEKQCWILSCTGKTCEETPSPQPTNTPPPPTNSPTPTLPIITNTPSPSPTPTTIIISSTPIPTSTPGPSPTPTATPPPGATDTPTPPSSPPDTLSTTPTEIILAKTTTTPILLKTGIIPVIQILIPIVLVILAFVL